jgi:predicted secreted protein
LDPLDAKVRSQQNEKSYASGTVSVAAIDNNQIHLTFRVPGVVVSLGWYQLRHQEVRNHEESPEHPTLYHFDSRGLSLKLPLFPLLSRTLGVVRPAQEWLLLVVVSCLHLIN